MLTALQRPVEKLPSPRADGDREALRILLSARDELTTATTAQTNRLRTLLRDGDDGDRDLTRARLTDATLAALERRRGSRHASRAQATRQAEMRRIALALREKRRELGATRAQLTDIVNKIAPGLTDQRGIGPITAAQAIVSFSHPGRCHSEAAFATLTGTSPLEASSGQTTRHRLNRGGDRALNHAIHTIAMMRSAPAPHPNLRRPPRRRRHVLQKMRRCLKRRNPRSPTRPLIPSSVQLNLPITPQYCNRTYCALPAA